MQTVLVVLGAPVDPDTPMPATITHWPKPRHAAYQYLSGEQLEAMNGDEAALWEADYVEGHYWLKTRLTDTVGPSQLVRVFSGRMLVLDESEIPF